MIKNVKVELKKQNTITEDFIEEIKNKLKDDIKDKYKYGVFIAYNNRKMMMLIYSGTHYTRAGDLQRYLSNEIPVFSGIINISEHNDNQNITSWSLAYHNMCGEIDNISLNLKSEVEIVVEKYESNTTIIDARYYFKENQNDIQQWEIYRKKKQARCYVCLSDLRKELGLKDDDEIIIKTLENKSGINLYAGESQIIMVGTNGETYCMEKEKFQELYNEDESVTDASDIYKNYELIPKVLLKNSSKEIDLLDYVSVCISKVSNRVYANEIQSGIYKVYSKNMVGTNNYYYGEGDRTPFFITVDIDKTTSVHIVRKLEFEKSYEKF